MPTIGPSLYLDLTATEAAQGKGFSVGDTHLDSDGNMARYVQAGSNVSQYMFVTIDGSNVAYPLTNGLGLAACEIGVAHYTNIASGSFGWVVIAGRPLGLVGGNAAPNLPIYTTTTAGMVDDATASAASFLLAGVKVHTANASSGAQQTRVVINYGAHVVIPITVGHS